MNGPNFTPQFLQGVPIAEWTFETVGDYDGDGFEDLLWYSSTGVVERWRMQGRTSNPIFEIITGIGTGWKAQ